MPDPHDPDRLILSFHIPKTGGTSFAAVLETRFPGGVAYYYKPHNRLTHPGLNARELVRDEAVLDRLETEGVRIVHGHMQSSWYAGMIDPSRWWTWVRDPVERVISAYYYQRKRTTHRAETGVDIHPRDRIYQRPLEEFAQGRKFRNQQSRVLSGAPLDAYGFVGVTERFAESLALLGISVDVEARNVNKSRPEVDPATRAIIAELNAEDVALYEQALRLHEARMGAEKP